MSNAAKRLTIFLTLLAVALPFAAGTSLQVRTAQGKAVAAPRPDKPGERGPAGHRWSTYKPVPTASPQPLSPRLAGPGTMLSVACAGQAAAGLHAAPEATPAVAAPATHTRILRMLVTAYCPCRRCCGCFSDGKTASGRSIQTNGAHFVAADTRILPFGTRLCVPGYHQGAPVEVLDRGGRIKGMRLDVFFQSHAEAKRWGARWLDVEVYEP